MMNRSIGWNYRSITIENPSTKSNNRSIVVYNRSIITINRSMESVESFDSFNKDNGKFKTFLDALVQ
ncbi:hypothetical protein [Psychrobacillus antarcticus]|uniref:hypothetical protein n=1 Tax=Psychrobacillus antarcticus TaxID=2879115 RepID=UPI002407AA77|nr:hypothetical protein [Psychrobacillus antarcticus]